MRVTRSLVLFLLAALATATCNHSALAQTAVLQGGSWSSGLIPQYSASGGSQPIVQSGGNAGGGAAGVNPAQIGITARGTGTAPFIAQGAGPNGEPFCIYDGPTTSAAGYHSVCLSANVGGAGLLSYQAGGAAAAQNINMKINGTSYEFPFVLSGVVGPSSSTIGNLACWNNVSGTLLSDCGTAGNVIREKLLADRTYYIRTDGSDSLCTGRTDAAYVSGTYPQNCAFLTWQHGADIYRTLDFNNHSISLQAGEEGAAKIFTQAAIQLDSIVGFGALYIKPSSSGTTIVGTSGAFFLQDTLQPIIMGGLTIRSSGSGYGSIIVNGKSTYQHDTIGPNYGASDGASVWVHDNQAQALILSSTYSLVPGNRNWHIVAANGGHIFHEANTVNAASGAVNMGVFALAQGGTIQASGDTFNNGANYIGARYSVQLSGFINSSGGGATYFPGSTAGTIGTLGNYVDTFTTTQYEWPGGINSQAATIVSSAASDPLLALVKTAGRTNYITGTTAGVNRWLIVPGDSTAEAGANAGSNFSIVASADNGSTIGTALGIVRSTMAATFGGTLTVTGAATLTGGATSTGDVFVSKSNPVFEVNKTASGQAASIYGTNNASLRWNMVLGNNTAEAGANVGSDFNLQAYSDTAVLIGTALTFTRSTMAASFGFTAKLAGVTLAGAGTCNAGAAGTMAYVTDSDTVTWGATILGGNSNKVMSFCDGSNWTVMGK